MPTPDTSSFFKVSLKTNNKDLAVALQTQKERSRQLEMDAVYLQKQVEALCFELASRRYKHRKLDLSELSDDYNRQSVDTNDDNMQMERPTVQLPPQPELSRDEMCPTKQTTMDPSEKDTSTNIVGIQSRPSKSSHTCKDTTNDMERPLSPHMQAIPTRTSCQSSSLRDEVERLSKIFSQSLFDINSVPCLQNGHTPSVDKTSEKPQPSVSDDVVYHPSSSVIATEPEHDNGQKTMLLNTMMEMTLSNATEIVTVETKGKENGSSSKLKRKKNTHTKNVAVVKAVKEDKKNKEQVSGDENRKSADSGLTEMQSAPTVTLLQADNLTQEAFTDTEIIKLQPHNAQSRTNITSRNPKLNNSEACNRQKTSKEIVKSCDPAKSKSQCHNIVLPEQDDYFMDPVIQCSKGKDSVKFSSEKDIPEEARSKTKCKKNSLVSKTDQSVTRKTFVISSDLPSCERDRRITHSERKRSKTLQLSLDHHDDELEEENKGEYEACQDQQLHKEFLACADDNVTLLESEHVCCLSLSGNKPQSKIQTPTDSGGKHRTRCRETFVISVTRDSSASNSASSEVGAVEQVFVPATGYNWVAEESPAVMDANVLP
ncbi:shugoshin 2A [Centroberyx affinis]|uniref:shugoshin 2A n=1 Tax=Centroberyx affinis TaxID=166261 RepID=UPI003A5C32D9